MANIIDFKAHALTREQESKGEEHDPGDISILEEDTLIMSCPDCDCEYLHITSNYEVYCCECRELMMHLLEVPMLDFEFEPSALIDEGDDDNDTNC